MSTFESIPLHETQRAASQPDREFDPYVRDATMPTTYPPAGQEDTTERPYARRGSSSEPLTGRPVKGVDYAIDMEKGAPRGYATQDIPPPTKPVKLFNWLKTASLFVRWIVLVIPVSAILWIPGILGFTLFPKAHVWGVKLLWWSIWLSVLWGGWWTALLVSHMLPRIARYTIGTVAVRARRYIGWLSALHKFIAAFLWTLGIWIAWTPLITRRQDPNTTQGNHNAVALVAKLLFGFFLCAAVLLAEKFAIQFIAAKFHERTYADRIADQKRATKILVVLYENSNPAAANLDEHSKNGSTTILARAFSGLRGAAQSTSSVFGGLTSEILGSSILQPNSPEAMILDALGSANKTRLLAKRIYFSFKKPTKHALYKEDIAHLFPSPEAAEDAFMLFDKDGNGDATKDEVELACMECHREQLSIANSMKDLDSAVGRLDNIFMSVYSLIAALIIAVVLDSELTTLLAGVGTFVLGLSWLIGSSLAEVLTSIIFLFIKHPYDVGDRIIVDGVNYTVKEIRLLSTIFLDKNNTSVQAPHNSLNTKNISNIRRSPTMSETFSFDVAFDTTFKQIEDLRLRMLDFVKEHNRDYLPVFDITVVDFPDQEKISLTADIKYKSNWQQGAIKSQRRNKWVVTLKDCLHELKIYGPGGAGAPPSESGPVKYTQVPYEEVIAAEHAAKRAAADASALKSPASVYQFSDKQAALLDQTQDVFGESEQLTMPVPNRGYDGMPSHTTDQGLRYKH